MKIHGPAAEGALPKPVPVVPLRPERPLPVAPESAFLRAARGLGREIDVGEARVASASRLRDYDPATLIALQAGIYRYSEAVDLTSKVVDRATNAVHTVFSSAR